MELFAALDRCPLTALQLLKVSQTFAVPFTAERCVRERLLRLCVAGRVRRGIYATASRGALGYYSLTSLGYRLLHGRDAIPPRRLGHPIALASQSHTQALADVLVHTAVSAHQAGIAIAHFTGENMLQLTLGNEHLYPDSAFQLVLPPPLATTTNEEPVDGRDDVQTFSFYLELDNGSQAVHSTKDLESWERKLRFYDRLQDQSEERFRVLVISTKSSERLDHILRLAAETTRLPERSLVYGATLSRYLADNPVVFARVQNHRGLKVSLLPSHVGTAVQAKVEVA